MQETEVASSLQMVNGLQTKLEESERHNERGIIKVSDLEGLCSQQVILKLIVPEDEHIPQKAEIEELKALSSSKDLERKRLEEKYEENRHSLDHAKKLKEELEEEVETCRQSFRAMESLLAEKENEVQILFAFPNFLKAFRSLTFPT